MFELFRAAVGTIIEAKVSPCEDDLYHFLDRREWEEDIRQIRVILLRLSPVISLGENLTHLLLGIPDKGYTLSRPSLTKLRLYHGMLVTIKLGAQS
jgi:hypothetical protein